MHYMLYTKTLLSIGRLVQPTSLKPKATAHEFTCVKTPLANCTNWELAQSSRHTRGRSIISSDVESTRGLDGSWMGVVVLMGVMLNWCS
eukprot:829056-Prorocentrum_minimum.AAC.6